MLVSLGMMLVIFYTFRMIKVLGVEAGTPPRDSGEIKEAAIDNITISNLHCNLHSDIHCHITSLESSRAAAASLASQNIPTN